MLFRSATTKAGIIKPESHVVLAAQEQSVAKILMEKIAEKVCIPYREGVEFSVTKRAMAVGGQVMNIQGVFGEYKGYQLMESQIRYAMDNTTSNAEAAKWLRVSFATWKKYAKMYIDEATGKTLYDLHKENGFAKRLVLPQSRYRRKASAPWAFQPLPIDDIFANKIGRAHV